MTLRDMRHWPGSADEPGTEFPASCFAHSHLPIPGIAFYPMFNLSKLSADK